MDWYYATKEKTQAGPVDEGALVELLRTGTISSTTLIWKQGMDTWRPYSAVFGKASLSMGSSGKPRCSECGLEFESEDLVSIGGHTVCARCKPVAVQKLQEGVVAFDSPVDVDALLHQLEEQGFDFTISSVMSRAWGLVKGNFWPCVGVILLGYLITMAASQIPFAGILATFLVQGQIMAGAYWYLLKQFRGQEASLNDIFAGFKRGYWQQALFMLIIFAASIGVILAVGLPAFFASLALSGGTREEQMVTALIVAGLTLVPVTLVLWYFMTCWIFTPILILDKGLTATKAMKLSRKAVGMRFWKVLAILLLLVVLGIAGMLALIIGLIFVMPLALAVIVRMYEDAFGQWETKA